jgi:hypothetical protein
MSVSFDGAACAPAGRTHSTYGASVAPAAADRKCEREKRRMHDGFR